MSSPPARGRTTLWRTVQAYLLLPHAVPVIVVIATTAAFAVLAARGLPPVRELARLLLAMLGSQVAIGAVNEIVDADLDQRAKPRKPIPAGLVSIRAALALTAVALVTMTAFSLSFGWRSFALCALGTGSGIAYSVWFKRSLYAWVPYLVALPLLPIWVFTSLTDFKARLLMLYPLGLFAVLGVYLSQSLPDVSTDRAAGIGSLSATLGERRAIRVCWGSTLAAAALASALVPILTDHPRFTWAAAGAATILVLANIGLYLRRPRRGVMICFPCVAVATAVLGLGWVLSATR